MTKLDLSLTRVGTLVALASLSSSFAQPVFGLIGDRLRRPWFIAFGPLTAALFMSGIGMAPTYGALVGLLMLAGLGVAAFDSRRDDHGTSGGRGGRGWANRGLPRSRDAKGVPRSGALPRRVRPAPLSRCARRGETRSPRPSAG